MMVRDQVQGGSVKGRDMDGNQYPAAGELWRCRYSIDGAEGWLALGVRLEVPNARPSHSNRISSP